MKCVTKKCKQCGKEFTGHHNATLCSPECKLKNKQLRENRARYEASLAKYSDNSDPDSYVICAICGFRSSDIGYHISIHDISSEEYKKIHGPVVCLNKRNLFTGENNPAYNHGGKYSPFSKNFINYKSDEYIEELKKTSVETKNENNNNPLTVDYYISRGYSQEEAKQALKDRQTTFSLEKCIDKYGLEEGKKVWAERQYKWANSYKKQNFSKISQELFHAIYENYNSTEIYFATKDKSIDKNQEYRLKLFDDSVILPDFICMNTKRIIEFDGDYWHSESVANPAKEKLRDEKIVNSGYTVLHIKEYDFKKDRQHIIEQCLNYLTR